MGRRTVASRDSASGPTLLLMGDLIGRSKPVGSRLSSSPPATNDLTSRRTRRSIRERCNVDGTAGSLAQRARPDDLPDGLLEALERLIFAAIGLTTVAIEQAGPGDLTLQQWRALVVIGRTAGVHVTDVAVGVGISLPSASRLIARLEERGYVTTDRDERDRRATLITLTTQGARVRRDVINRRRYLMLAAFGSHATELPPDFGRDLATLTRTFEDYT